MSNSPLVDYTRLSPNCNSPRNHDIDTITIHMTEGQVSIETLGDIFSRSSRGASSNYGIGPDGRVGMYVEEKNRSWCSGNKNNDHRAITIECASDKTYPYAVKDASYEKLIALLVDIVKRNPGFKGSLRWKNDKALIGNTDEQNMTLHKWFQSTNCPGEWLESRMAQIATEVNRRLKSEHSFEVNDIVYFKGAVEYNSSTSSQKIMTLPSLARVTKVASGAAHPYHCRKIDPKGNYASGGVYGWVSADDIVC